MQTAHNIRQDVPSRKKNCGRTIRQRGKNIQGGPVTTSRKRERAGLTEDKTEGVRRAQGGKGGGNERTADVRRRSWGGKNRGGSLFASQKKKQRTLLFND